MKHRRRLTSLVSLAAVLWACGAAAAAQAPPKDNLCSPRKKSYPSPFNPKLDKLDIAALSKLVDKGDADAMVLLGLKYAPSPERTAESPPVDTTMALSLFERAAAKGHGFGEYLVGVAHMAGAGVPKDDAKALEWFRRSAKRGTPIGAFWVGELTAKGRAGLMSDWKAALPHFVRAAEGGVSEAYVELGFAYSNGVGGLAMSREKAAYCFRQGMVNSIIAQYNLRLLIDQGHITWQPGDPGVAPKPKN